MLMEIAPVPPPSGDARVDSGRRRGVRPLRWAVAAAALFAAGCGHDSPRVAVARSRPPDGELPPPAGRVVIDPPPQVVFTPFAASHEQAERVARLIVDLVERRTGLVLAPIVADSYDDVERRLYEGGVTFAFLAPLLYVRVTERFERDATAHPGVRLRLLLNSVSAGSPTYLGYVVAAADTPIRRLADTAGVRFGMVEGSTSGYLFPLDLVSARGMDVERTFRQVRFFPSHAAVVAELLEPPERRSIDAAALYDHMVDTLDEVRRARVRVIAKTARIPRDTLVVLTPIREGVEDRRILDAASAFQHALMALGSYPETAREVRAGLGFDGWIVGDDRRYDTIREVYRRYSHYRFAGATPAEIPHPPGR